MTDEVPLSLALRDKFVIINKFSVDFPSREDWSRGFVDLVASNQLIFFNGTSVFSDFLNDGESYALCFHAKVFQPEVYAFEGIVNGAISICSDSKADLLALKSYAVSSRVVLLCRDCLCLTEFVWPLWYPWK
jgi:hypothetical protein